MDSVCITLWILFALQCLHNSAPKIIKSRTQTQTYVFVIVTSFEFCHCGGSINSSAGKANITVHMLCKKVLRVAGNVVNNLHYNYMTKKQLINHGCYNTLKLGRS